MGRVAGAYGVRGWVKAVPQAGVQDGLAGAKEWWLDGVRHRVAQAKRHSATVIAKLEGIDTPEQARSLKGREIAVARGALPEAGAGHYYLADLLGLEVVNTEGEKLGVVRHWYTNGPQDLMEVAGDAVRLVPWVAAVVRAVDLEAGVIEVEWGADW
jgi:16S rRNA processing protein RimM